MKKSELKALIREVVEEVYSQQTEGFTDIFRSNKSKLIKMLEKEGFVQRDEGEWVKTMELHDDGTEGTVEISFADNDTMFWKVREHGFDSDDTWGSVKNISKKSSAELQKIVDGILHKVNRTDAPSPNSAAYKKYNADREARRWKNYETPEEDGEGEEWKSK